MNVTPRGVRAVGVTLAGITIGVVGLSALGYFVIDRDVARELFQYVYVGSEMNLPTWWNVSLLLLVALFSLLAAALHRTERRAWSVVAATAGFLSLDEGSRLHERLGHLVGHIDVPTFGWVLVAAVIAPVGIAVLWWATRHLPRTTRAMLGGSVAVYVFAALGLEVLGGYAFHQDHWRVFLTLTHLEEMLEMLAAGGAATAILAHLAPLQVSASSPSAPAAHSAPDAAGPRTPSAETRRAGRRRREVSSIG